MGTTDVWALRWEARVEFGMLGPLVVWADDGSELDVGGPRERKALAVLLLNADRVVSVDRLVETLWAEDPPVTAGTQVRNTIAALRRGLGGAGGMIHRVGSGFTLRLEGARLDADVFTQLVAQARCLSRQGDLVAAADMLRQALALWRGPAIGGLGGPVLDAAGYRLEEQRLACVEQRVELDLALGRHTQVVGELAGLVAQHPLRERLVELHMLALHRAGRRQDALDVFTTTRTRLAERAGLDPRPELIRLQQAILRGDPDLEPAPIAGRATSPAATHAPSARASVNPTGDVDARDTAAVRPVVPAQLPADVADFTGRAFELQELDSLAGGGQAPAVVVTAIAGTAGVGKTALAVHWAHLLRHRFPDGQLYVNLRGYAAATPMRPIEALGLFLPALGVPAEKVPIELEHAAGMFRSLLADRRVLIVLDNAGEAEQVRPLLPGGPGNLVLVTSRDALAGLIARDGARRLTLDMLSPPEAHTLLARLLGPRRMAAEPDAAAELARQCGNLPLALRIVAANLIGQPQQSIAGYVARLRDGNLLAELAVDGDEHTAVRAAFDLSYTALPAPTRRLFRLLGLVPGPDVTTEAAAALSDTTAEDAARLLGRLAAAHLIHQHAPDRYGLHDLLRVYAMQRCTAEDDPLDRHTALSRLYWHYLHRADTAANQLYPETLRLPVSPEERPPTEAVPAVLGDAAHASAWLDAERANLVTAVTRTAEHGPHWVAWRLADALRGYLGLRMHTVDWLAVATAGLAAASADHEPRAQAASRLSLADLHTRLGRYEHAITNYTQASALAVQAGWTDGQAAAVGNLGIMYAELGRLKLAADHLTQAWAFHRHTDRLVLQATCLHNLGYIQFVLGRLALAADHYTQALAVYRRVRSLRGEASALGGLGQVFHRRGRHDDAKDHLSRALTLMREAGDRHNEAEAVRCLATVDRDSGRHDEARRLTYAALTIARDIGDRRNETDALHTLASIQDRCGEHQQAIDNHRQALYLARDIGHRFAETETLIGLAAARCHLGQNEQALTHAHHALNLSRQYEYRMLEGQALASLAAIRLAQADPDQAISNAEQALAVHRETGHRLDEARTHLILGHAFASTHHADTARAHWQQALDLFTDIGTPEAGEIRAILGIDDPSQSAA